MRNLAAHLPMDRLQALIQGNDLPLQSAGTVLLADLADFTPLTEMLVRDLGSRRGAEALTALLDQVYEQLVERVHGYGGSVIGFSGDALTAWFGGQDAAPAIACGLAMQSSMEAFSPLNLPSGHLITLQLKVAISGGAAVRCVVGDPALHRIDVLAGEAVDRLGRLERLARDGETLVDQRLAGADSRLVTGVRRTSEDGEVSGVVVTALAAAVPPQEWAGYELPDSLAAELETWVAPAVLARLRDDHRPFLTELRPIGALFLQFTLRSAAPDVWRSELDAYIRDVQRVLTRFDGTLVQLTIGDKGSYLYAVFGAPVAHEDDTARLIQAALALSRLPGTAPARPRIGIAQGTARTGIYGGASRRTYGALGDAVNLAARLMDQARPGDILANDLIWQAAPPGIRWDVLPPRAIKGKQQDLILARLIDWADASRTAAEPRSGTPLVGRSPQLRIIRECLEQARRGHGHVVVISGDAGIGKSRVVSEIYQRQAGWQTLSGGGQSYRMAQPYSAWTPVWQRIFGMDPAMPAAANIERISAALAGWDPAQLDRLPLLSSVLSLAIPENSLTGGLEAKLRKSLLEALLADCFRAYANAMARSGRPVLIVIEDAHWLDQLSLDLVEHIGAIIADVPAALVVTTRTSGEGDGHPLAGLLARPHARSLTLHELAPAEVSELLALRWRQLNLHESTLTMERLREQIIPRSSGNPFFIEELVSFLATSPATLDEHTGWQGVELPQSLHRLVLSRIDRLEEHHQRVLKVASVLGTEFPQAWLEECYPAGEASGRIEHDLAVLKGHNLLSADSAPGMCRFRHAITQEITYESLAQRTQQALHEQVAGYLEGGAGPADQHLDLLAYHYGRSPNDRKALWYLARNAERAARLFANHDAVRDYQAALERAAGLRGELPFPAETLPRGLGDVYAQMAEFDAALERYAQALDLLPAESRLQRAEIHLQRAEVLTRATRFDQAAAEIEQGELLLNQADGPQAQTAARIMLARGAELRARTWMQQANSHKALEAAEQGLRYLEGIPPSHERAVTTRVKLQYALASAIAALRSYDQARRVLRHTLRLLRRVPNPAIEGELNVRWGTAALRHGYPRVAATMLKKAQPLVAATGVRDRLAQVVFLSGQARVYCGEIAEALALVEEGTQIAKQTGSAFQICGGLFNLGWIHNITGNWDTSLRYIREGQALARQHSLGRIIDLLNYEAEIVLYRGNYAAARDIFAEVIRVGERLDIPFAIEIASNNMAYINLLQGDISDDLGTAEAIPTVVAPVDSLTKVHHTLEVANRWALFKERGRHIECDPAVLLGATQSNLEFLVRRSQRIFQPYAFRVNAMVNFYLGDPLAALDSINRGVQVGRRIGYVHDLARNLFWRAKIRHAIRPDQLRQARRDLGEAARLFEALGARPELGQTQALLSQVAP